jgi:hypothetical protein
VAVAVDRDQRGEVDVDVEVVIISTKLPLTTFRGVKVAMAGFVEDRVPLEGVVWSVESEVEKVVEHHVIADPDIWHEAS